jgi:hypothetical protein
MGAMPIEARLVPAELRKLFKLLNLRLVWFVLRCCSASEHKSVARELPWRLNER